MSCSTGGAIPTAPASYEGLKSFLWMVCVENLKKKGVGELKVVVIVEFA